MNQQVVLFMYVYMYVWYMSILMLIEELGDIIYKKE